MDNSLTKKERIFVFLSFFYVLYTIFPLFGDITGIPAYAPAALVVVVLYSLYPQAIMTKSTFWFYCYIGVLFFYIFIGKRFHINGLSPVLSQTYRVLIEAGWILPSVTIVNVLNYKNNPYLYKIIGFGSIILLVLSFLYILPLVLSSANYLRASLGEEQVLRPMGLPAYDLMHAYTLMLLPLCLMLKKSMDVKQKLLYLIILVLFIYIIIQTSVTTSLVLALLVFIFVLIFDANAIPSSLFKISVLALIAYVLYLNGFFLIALKGLMPYFEGTAVAYKIQDLYDSLILGKVTGESLTARQDLHMSSKMAFYNNPLWGDSVVGGHSKVLDMLGTMGLIGFVPFVMIIISIMKSYISRIRNKELNSYLCFSFILSAIFLYTKGIFGGPGFLFTFLLVPVLIMLVKNNENFK